MDLGVNRTKSQYDSLLSLDGCFLGEKFPKHQMRPALTSITPRRKAVVFEIGRLSAFTPSVGMTVSMALWEKVLELISSPIRLSARTLHQLSNLFQG
jgi:hypothetical protein